MVSVSWGNVLTIQVAAEPGFVTSGKKRLTESPKTRTNKDNKDDKDGRDKPLSPLPVGGRADGRGGPGR
jgi:hypothetical protein